jgi:hypothetical protein
VLQFFILAITNALVIGELINPFVLAIPGKGGLGFLMMLYHCCPK